MCIMKAMKTRKELVLDTVTDMVSNFLYYDRKEDESLPLGAIEEMVEKNEISIEEIVSAFRRELTEGLSEE